MHLFNFGCFIAAATSLKSAEKTVVIQVREQLTALALFLSEPASCVEREPEYLFNAIWQFAQDFDRAYLQVVKCAESVPQSTENK